VAGRCDGVFFASLIRAMISRQREYLADASAVQFTRNPGGIGGALRVIGGTWMQGRLETRAASECSHMMFVSSAAGWLEGAMATHPPLEERIRRVDPQWDGTFLQGREVAGGTPADEPRVIHDVSDAGPVAMLRPAGPSAALQSAAEPARTVGGGGRGDSALAFAGGLTPEEVFFRLETARATLAAIPDKLTGAARDAFTARALLLGMLLDRDADLRYRQVGLVARLLGDATAQNARVLARELRSASRGLRLPLIELSVASLATMSAEQYRLFRGAVKEVINADDQVDLFELCLEQTLINHLDHRYVDARPVPVQYYVLNRLGREVSTLLWAVAHAAEGVSADAPGHVAAALRGLSLGSADPGVRPRPHTDEVVASLAVMRQVTPRVRARVLTACASLVGADGRIDPQESELLRAMADTLNLPLAVAAVR